jgi:hypothetical protein
MNDLLPDENRTNEDRDIWFWFPVGIKSIWDIVVHVSRAVLLGFAIEWIAKLLGFIDLYQYFWRSVFIVSLLVELVTVEVIKTRRFPKVYRAYWYLIGACLLVVALDWSIYRGMQGADSTIHEINAGREEIQRKSEDPRVKRGAEMLREYRMRKDKPVSNPAASNGAAGNTPSGTATVIEENPVPSGEHGRSSTGE